MSRGVWLADTSFIDMSAVWDRANLIDDRMEFMKQVLPRLRRPTAPGAAGEPSSDEPYQPPPRDQLEPEPSDEEDYGMCIRTQFD